MANKEKVVLAYSGGLDTSVAIKWLQEKYAMEVIAVAVDVGQGEDLKPLREKALKIGAIEAVIIDARKEFVNDFILPSLKANALYEGKYPLVSALSRPLISKHLVRVAQDLKATHVAHGCTGKGNDQVRFEISIASLDPSLEIVAPIREAKMSRNQALEYAKKHQIPLSTGKKSPYSIDENLWGRAIEGEDLEDLLNEPKPEAFELTEDPQEAPDEPGYLTVDFEDGKPVALDGKTTSFPNLIQKVNETAGRHGFGRIDMIENRAVGIKSRELYEAPGALTLLKAHKDLEELTLERSLLHFKRELEPAYAELIYTGQWFSPLKQALDAFIEETQQYVTGAISLKFYKGSAKVVKRKSDYSLYDFGLATYGKEDQFSHESAKGFIELSGLPLKIWARKHRRR
ncbi:MAG TPA: argininosuccinate synthase [Candidatus Subteraquimicrobiales bacterium]